MLKKVVLAGLGFFAFTALSFGTQIFSTNSVWHFRKGNSEASSPNSAWRATAFNDTGAGFINASAPFWYGDVRPGGTQLTDMLDSYSCIFLRRTFMIGNASAVSSLRLRAFVDDGFVAWINGVEVARTNVTVAQPTYQTLATNTAEPVEFITYNLPAPSGYLTTGTNVLTLQVFNASLGSSDFGFDCLLDATIVDTTPPTIVGIAPPPGNVNSLTSVSVTFSEPVIGLTADDFLITGVPISTMSVSGNTYTFNFQQPFYGPVSVNWTSGHGITDLATPPNAFNAGAPWQYNLIDVAPPAVTNLVPPAGLTVRSLGQIEVTFNEVVQGVQASDLLINGQPATSLTHALGERYIFSFPPPAAGLVEVAWAAGHGITDTATPPNPFAGGSWNCVVDPNAPLGDLVINEFLAANISTNGLADEDGEQQDWIEIRNRGTNAVNLEGWSLSDDAALPGLWTFPARTLAPHAYLVVFASGKDRRSTNSASRLHTNFKLGSDGEHLGLYTPDSPRVLMHGFTLYPEQRNDVSYGVDSFGTPFYYATPTPGAANGVSTIIGVCAPVHANVKRGYFSTPFDLMLSCSTPGATLRYTINGSEPTTSSAIFPSSLRVSSTTLFRAAAFKANYLPSKTITDTYFFNLPSSIRSLPMVSIVTAANNLYGPSGILGINGGNYDTGPWQSNAPGDYHNPSQHGLAWERETSIEWIRPDDNSGFQAECGIRAHGSDYKRARLTTGSKFSFAIYFRSDYGGGRLEYPLFPLTGVDRFDQLVLRGGHNDPDNPFIRDELVRRLSGDMGQLASHGNLAVLFVNGVYYSGSPWFNPCERVHEEFFQEHLGGSDDWDVVGPSNAQSAGLPGVVDGDRTDFQNMVSYVTNNTVTTQSVYTNIARWLDLTNFADYCMLNAYAGMGDWPANNWRAGKDRSASGPWRFVLWDGEFGMGIYGRSVTINSFTLSGTDTTDAGLASVSKSEIARLYNRLRASPEFRLLWADLVQKHFFNGGALTGAHITNRFDEMRTELAQLIPDMDISILDWVRDRQPIFFNQMNSQGLLSSVTAPSFSQFGGRVPAGFSLTITAPAGTIYYTTNGSDPRVAFTGAVSSSALTYSGAVPLNNTVTIRSRALSSGNWSAMTEAAFTVGSLGVPLRITEIMYNPPGGSLYEYLELQNTGLIPVDLSGMYLDGVTFIFNEGTSLAGGARLILGSNVATNSWKALYAGVSPFGWFNGNLNNGGERITLFDRNGNIITSVDYSDGGGWPTAADGAGRSLEVINANGDPDDPANWKPSAANNGTPGAANSAAPAQDVFLNEVLAENFNAVDNGGTFPDWIELRNPGGSPVNITGWSLTDDGNARKFVFPNGTTIDASGYLVVWCDATTNTTPGLHTGFSLDKDGETVSLYDASTNRVDALTFGLQLTNYSVGRISGNWTLNTPTPNAVNAAATLAPATDLAINEWLANPVPGQEDWIELFNKSSSLPVSLRGIYLATSNGLHQLAALSFLPPLGYVQLFADEGVGPDHLDFKLSASGDAIVLSDATGGEVQRVTFGAQSQGVSQGRLPDGSASVLSFPGSASPKAPNYTATYTGAVINEALARNQTVSVGGQFVDFIEIFNPNGGSFNLGGMSLSVNSQQPGEWTFPPATAIGGNSYLLVKCDGSSPASTNAGSFNTGESLDGESGGVYLFNAAGQLVNSVEYGLQVNDLSIGLSGGQWKLLSSPTPGSANSAVAALGTNTSLRINEWMAAPAKGDDWFEIYNTTNRPVDLSTVSLSDDPSLVGRSQFRPVPLSFIGPKGFVKWVADSSAGQGRNHVNFALDGEGDSILIYGVNGLTFTPLDAIAFGAETPGVSKGSLPDGVENAIAFPGSPTPGESNYRLLTNVFINEALMHTDPPLEDAVEFYNPAASPLNIGGWYLSNSRDNLRKYKITNGVTIPAGGYTVIYENLFNNGTSNAFTLNSAHGDEIWLSAATNGVETGNRATVQFGASFNGVSFGRVVTSVGVDFWPLAQRTFGVDSPASVAQFRTGTGLFNAGPAVGPVIINEIFYNPPGGTNGSDEYIELHNTSGSMANLYDPAYPTNRWKLGGGVDFTFPANQNLPADGYLLVVDFDPVNSPATLADFRARYGISVSVPVYGPFAGSLANDEDSVELYRSDMPQQAGHPDEGFVPFVLVDRVRYTHSAPWPTGDVDGGGHSLYRLDDNLYGNEPFNWGQSAPTPGAVNVAVLTDTDGDGIPDAVELQMGLNPNNPADGADDDDGDGATNYEEYIAGTDHENPDSSLKLNGSRANGSAVLTFDAIANRTYSVLYKDSLTSPVWSKLINVPAQGVNHAVSVTNLQTGVQTRFYQLVTPATLP